LDVQQPTQHILPISSITDSTVDADDRVVGFWHTAAFMEDDATFLFIGADAETNKLNVMSNMAGDGDNSRGVFSGLTRHLANNLWLFEIEIPQDIYDCFRPYKSRIDQAEFAADMDQVSATHELGMLNKLYFHFYYKIVSVSELETELLGKSVTERFSIKEDIENEANRIELDPNQIDVLLFGAIDGDDWRDTIRSGELKGISVKGDNLGHFVLIAEPPEALKNFFVEANNEGKLAFELIGLRRRKE